ncbi:MAG TPA: ABC transporter permease subunit [Acidimicrobiales bacterium]|nr:ABC transporter permease subunit [Acidimicrobiales bacterium]
MNRLIRTELLKQRTTRTFTAALAAVPVVAGLVVVASFSAAGKQGNEPLGPDHLLQAVGAPASVVTLIALLLGVLGTAGEYRHQTITTTFLGSPRRRQVVVAKLAVHALVGAALGVLSVAVSTAVALPWLRSGGIPVELSGDVLRVGAGLVLSAALYGALGVSVGALVRNQTTAVAVVLVWLLAVEGLVGDVFAGSGIVHWLPAAAGRALVHGASGDGLSAPLAAALFATYVVVLAVAAVRFTVRRDVT